MNAADAIERVLVGALATVAGVMACAGFVVSVVRGLHWLVT